MSLWMRLSPYDGLGRVIAWGSLLLLAPLTFAQTPAAGGDTAADADDGWVPYSSEQLETLVGPIALYPDELLAIVLPAAAYPLQIVQAARFLDDHEQDASLEPDAEWDDAVVALLNYPEVLRMMNDDLDWTWELGEAVVYQQADVLAAVQGFRDRAQAAGNLQSDQRQRVSNDEGTIRIAPAEPEVVYVPYYVPERVVVYQRAPAVHYYPYPYPLYYYPYPTGYSFSTGFFWGVTTAFTIGWHTYDLHVHHHGYRRHPYYGRHYHAPYYARHTINIDIHVDRASHVWRPRHRHGARPVYDDRPRTVSRGRPALRRERIRARPGFERERRQSDADRAVDGRRMQRSPTPSGRRSPAGNRSPERLRNGGSITANRDHRNATEHRGRTPGPRDAARANAGRPPANQTGRTRSSDEPRSRAEHRANDGGRALGRAGRHAEQYGRLRTQTSRDGGNARSTGRRAGAAEPRARAMPQRSDDRRRAHGARSSRRR